MKPGDVLNLSKERIRMTFKSSYRNLKSNLRVFKYSNWNFLTQRKEKNKPISLNNPKAVGHQQSQVGLPGNQGVEKSMGM